MITKISRMGRLPHFRRYGATLARAWTSSKNNIIGVLEIYLVKKIRNELYHRSVTSLRKMDIGRIEIYPAQKGLSDDCRYPAYLSYA